MRILLIYLTQTKEHKMKMPFFLLWILPFHLFAQKVDSLGLDSVKTCYLYDPSLYSWAIRKSVKNDNAPYCGRYLFSSREEAICF
jgi:hypothetical protein